MQSRRMLVRRNNRSQRTKLFKKRIYILIYSKEEELAIQLISEETICNTKAFKTTTDFYVIFDDQLNEITFGITSIKMTFNKQHNINDLILAEEDKRYYDYLETKREIEDEEV